MPPNGSESKNLRNDPLIYRIISENFPDQSISAKSGTYTVAAEWSWFAGKPKRYGNFFLVKICTRTKPYTSTLALTNIARNYIPLLGITFALTKIGWSDWIQLFFALLCLYGVVSWHFYREYIYYTAQAKSALEAITNL